MVTYSIARNLILAARETKICFATRNLCMGFTVMADKQEQTTARDQLNYDENSSQSTKPNLAFVSRTNPITGKMDWVVQDENYDYLQEIARSGYGDMLHDKDRNEKYYQAIRQAVKLLKMRGKQVRTLDIGTGTGLLSMMAAEAGADVLTACEAFPPMAKCAEKVLAANGYQNKIKLVHKRSDKMTLADMGKRANLLVTELFDTELIGEGAVGSYTDAHARLMEEDCLAVPTTGIMYVQAVHCDLLQGWNDLLPVKLPNGKVISSPRSYLACGGAPSLHDLQVDELQGHLQFISSPVEVFRFDFSRRNALHKEESSVHTTTALLDGSVDAFVMWWDLVMDPQGEIILSCAPCWIRPKGESVPWRDHWMQALYYPSSLLTVKEGEQFDIHSSHDEYSLWFDTVKTVSERPVCECGLHVAFSRSRLGQINEDARNHVFIQALEKHITNNSVCLVISDGSLLSLFAACLGAKRVFCLDNNWACQRIIQELIEHNNLQDRVTLLSKDAEDITSEDLENLKVDLVIAEPFFQAAHLPWEHLYFWYAVQALQPYLKRDVLILPQTMTVKAIAVEFRDLHKIRAPVGHCEGFDITEFDRLIEASSDSADEEIEPQPLWEYPAVALTQPETVMSMNFSNPPEHTDQKEIRTELACCREGTLNGVVLWTEFGFGENLHISTGVVDGDWQGKKIGGGVPILCVLRSNSTDCEREVPVLYIRWDMFSRQGVKIFRHGKQFSHGTVAEITSQFSPGTGDITVQVRI